MNAAAELIDPLHGRQTLLRIMMAAAPGQVRHVERVFLVSLSGSLSGSIVAGGMPAGRAVPMRVRRGRRYLGICVRRR
jgi:hypothetical protein